MRPDPATAFAPVLSNVDTGTLVRVEFENLPGSGEGPAGIARVHGVAVEVLRDAGSVDGGGRYYRSVRLRDASGSGTTDYRLDYRGTAHGETWVRQYAGENPFDGGEEWGRRRRVYAVEVEGDGITARRERAGHTFDGIQDYE